MHGIIINELPAQIDAGQISQLMKAETATIGHFQHACFMTGLRPFGPYQPVAGTAVTLRLAGQDSALLHHIVSHLRPGDVLIIDRCGDARHACWGGVLSHAANHARIAGVVIDGAITDTGIIRDLGLPVWARSVSPVTTKIYGISGAFNVPVVGDGVVVNPGDAILADESGVVVLAPEEVGVATRRALDMQADELELLDRLAAGEPLGAITGASALIEQVVRSRG